MKKYRVPVRTQVIEIFEVMANSKEEAMNLALDDCDPDVCKSVDEIDGDPEVYYPDIYEVKE